MLVNSYKLHSSRNLLMNSRPIISWERAKWMRSILLELISSGKMNAGKFSRGAIMASPSPVSREFIHAVRMNTIISSVEWIFSSLFPPCSRVAGDGRCAKAAPGGVISRPSLKCLPRSDQANELNASAWQWNYWMPRIPFPWWGMQRNWSNIRSPHPIYACRVNC